MLGKGSHILVVSFFTGKTAHNSIVLLSGRIEIFALSSADHPHVDGEATGAYNGEILNCVHSKHLIP